MAKRRAEVRIKVFELGDDDWDFRIVGKGLGVTMKTWEPGRPYWKTKAAARKAGKATLVALRRAKFVL